MTLTDKLSHAAERKAFETILDNLIKKGQTQDAAQVATDLVNMVEKLHQLLRREQLLRRAGGSGFRLPFDAQAD